MIGGACATGKRAAPPPTSLKCQRTTQQSLRWRFRLVWPRLIAEPERCCKHRDAVRYSRQAAVMIARHDAEQVRAALPQPDQQLVYPGLVHTILEKITRDQHTPRAPLLNHRGQRDERTREAGRRQ